MKLLINRIRYELYRILGNNYLREKALTRKGSCNMCAKCEEVTSNNRCKFLNDNGTCSVYEDRFLFNPLCRVFPFDEKDKELINKDCGYYWDEK